MKRMAISLSSYASKGYPVIHSIRRSLALACFLTAAVARSQATLPAQDVKSLYAEAAADVPAYLETVKELVNIESGSGDLPGLDKITEFASARLQALGGKVEFIDGNATAARTQDTPAKIGRMVKATFTGTGKGTVLLIAHLDTVYHPGMLAKQPFRLDGDKAYGLAIADCKQGVATILHTVKLLKKRGFKSFGRLTVLLNSDEEINSPASQSYLLELGKNHDAVLSYEASRVANDKVSLATSGIAAAVLTVTGRASHAGQTPEKGINALYELTYQILQMRDLSDPKVGTKVNWTTASAGSASNVIPAHAEAHADVRVLRVSDYDGVERAMRQRIVTQQNPEAKVKLDFERRRPPLDPTPASRALAAKAQVLYKEIGMTLEVDPVAEGGGTDAAFASLQAPGAVIERFGVRGAGAHSNDDEYILVSSIAPRLYLSSRMVMLVGAGGKEYLKELPAAPLR